MQPSQPMDPRPSHPPSTFHYPATYKSIYFPASICMFHLFTPPLLFHHTLKTSNALFHSRFFSSKQKDPTGFCSPSYMCLTLAMFLQRSFHLSVILISISIYLLLNPLIITFSIYAIHYMCSPYLAHHPRCVQVFYVCFSSLASICFLAICLGLPYFNPIPTYHFNSFKPRQHLNQRFWLPFVYVYTFYYVSSTSIYFLCMYPILKCLLL